VRFGESIGRVSLHGRRAATPLELDVILAAVVELADLTGVKAPTLRAVHAVADLLASKVGV